MGYIALKFSSEGVDKGHGEATKELAMTVALCLTILTAGLLPLAFLRQRPDAETRPALYQSATRESLVALGRIHRPKVDPSADIVSLDLYRAHRARAAHPAGRIVARRSWGA